MGTVERHSRTVTRHPGTTTQTGEQSADALGIGRRIRHYRVAAGLTLGELGARASRAASQMSALENGKREPSLALLRSIAAALGVTVDDLIDPEPVDARSALELAVERTQIGPMYSALGIPHVKSTKSLPTEALEAIASLQGHLSAAVSRRAATPEEARRANRELREHMSAQNNHRADLEEEARKLLGAIGHREGPLRQQQTIELAHHLGFSLHYVADLPSSVRSISDEINGRLFLGNDLPGMDPRSNVLTALAAHVLGHTTPAEADFSEFLNQRVEANYLAAALLLPQDPAVRFLTEAKKARQISLEALRDAYGVSYETAAHRFTNLATEHLGIPVHFMKVHKSGTIHKVYSNDGLPFTTDAMGAVEGQYACKRFTSRTVFGVEDRFSPYFQYTDTPKGTFWCTARVLPDGGSFSVSVGVPFAHVKWFLGRETTRRSASRCPDPSCCRQPPTEWQEKWASKAWPAARTHASLLAAVPPGVLPGVDVTEVYQFLEDHPAP